MNHPKENPKIAVIGLGYIGLVVACCLAEAGFEVFGIERDEEKLKQLQNGVCPHFEPGLQTLFNKVKDDGHLQVDREFTPGFHTNIVFICVGTPLNADSTVDLTSFYESWKMIKGLEAKRPLVIVNKSTVPIGTLLRLKNEEGKNFPQWTFISNPEFLRQSTAIKDFLNPDRVVIGHFSQDIEQDAGAALLISLYKKLGVSDDKFILTTASEAEFIKYASNAYLATRLSFANEMLRLANSFQLNIETILNGVGRDHRIGTHYFKPGLGFGGSCLPKDLAALIQQAQSQGLDLPVLMGTEKTNMSQPAYMCERILTDLKAQNKNTFKIPSFAFKEGTDDTRDSQWIKLAQMLSDQGIDVERPASQKPI